MQKITTFLWFNGQAEEAAKFYTSLFKGSKMGKITNYGDEFPDKAGQVMMAGFEIAGQNFVALNGGPQFHFTPAISFLVQCKTQKEIDHYWNNLAKGGKEIQCGWVTDRFGVTWQIVPEILQKFLGDKDAEKAGRAMKAMLKMVKLDIAKLKKAHAGR